MPNDVPPGQMAVPAKRAPPQPEPVAAAKHKPVPSVAPAPVAQAPEKATVAVMPEAAPTKREHGNKPSPEDATKGNDKGKRNQP